jgi:DNA-binding beta-propeller fold protein YncE
MSKHGSHLRRRSLALSLSARGLALGLLAFAAAELRAQPLPDPWKKQATRLTAALVRVTATSAFSPASPDPSGITYDSARDRLVICDAEVEEMGIWANRNVFETTRTGTLTRSYNVTAYSDEPTGAAFDPNTRGIYFSDDDARRVFVVLPGADNVVGTSDDTRTSFPTRDFGCEDPEGIAYDRIHNRLFLADGVGEEIWVLTPGANGIFNGAPPTGDDQVTHFDTGSFGASDPETVEYKEDSGTLLVLGRSGNDVVHEVTLTGALLAEIDLSAIPLDRPAGMAWAPTSNDPGKRSLYIVNRGDDNDSVPNENDGTLVEVSIGPPANTAADGAPTATVALHGAGPQPSRGTLWVDFSVGEGAATLELLDVTGRRYARIDAGAMGAGRHQVRVAEGLPAGIYLVLLRQGGLARTMKSAVFP